MNLTWLTNLSSPIQDDSQKGTQAFKTSVNAAYSNCSASSQCLLNTPWLSDLASYGEGRPIYNKPPGYSLCRESGKERHKYQLQCGLQRMATPQMAPVTGFLCGVHRFRVQFGHRWGGKEREGQCVDLEVV